MPTEDRRRRTDCPHHEICSPFADKTLLALAIAHAKSEVKDAFDARLANRYVLGHGGLEGFLLGGGPRRRAGRVDGRQVMSEEQGQGVGVLQRDGDALARG